MIAASTQQSRPVLPTPWELLKGAHNKDEFMIAMRDLIHQEREITNRDIKEALGQAKGYTDIRIFGQTKVIDEAVGKHFADCKLQDHQPQPDHSQRPIGQSTPPPEVLKRCTSCGSMVKESKFAKNGIGNLLTICQDCEAKRVRIAELKAEIATE